MKIRPVIMCGGAGTRLWPKSRKNTPKQFIDWGGWTLFGKALERVKSSIFDYPIITTNSDYIDLVKKHILKHRIKKYKIILEPYKKNTAPAILSSVLLDEIPYNQPMIFFTSDNLIGNINQFNKAVNFHKKYLTDNNLFIFGIKPTSPSSEYGYFLTKKSLENLNKVEKFIEKPNKNKLKLIVKQKGYMNAGMFFARKDSLIKSYMKYQFDMFRLCSDSVRKSKIYKNIFYLDKNSFNKIKDISFDYAILEKSKNINGIKLNISLTDLGNWKEIWKFFKKYKSKNNINKNTFYRPWGKYINLFSGNGFLLKELVINPKSSISLQKHIHRSERWTVVAGKPKITINRSKFYKKLNETAFIPKGAVHRIENPFNKPVKIVEVQTGLVLKESDIIRYKDIYGRANL
tara:strand:+ start:100 stop:1308 length:1209 start_codon:yes stop_codon:yes gene_type:complete